MEEKIAGIIGGMGPEATVDLMQRIIRLTPADDDIDHVRCIVDNNPKVPSRIKAIVEGCGESPAPEMADMARRLAIWGADFLAIPCNTAHFYWDTVQAAVDIPVINLIDLVVCAVKEKRRPCKKVGVLASTAVLMTGLYEKRFKKEGIDVVYPEADEQKALLNVIKAVKAGDPSSNVAEKFKAICQGIRSREVDVLIIACTELSVISAGNMGCEVVDAAEVLAAHIVKKSKEG
ncbi:aspartate/glutamate racemase family protein [Dethiosulfatarculus sandiegensis]|nr:amino acid racemase [Dethiosulfatarculus sandiegensis]